MVMAHALDHIAATAAKSRSQTRRIRWIEQRALCALEGREYRDIDVELPKSTGPGTAEKLKAKADHYKRINAELLALLKDWREACGSTVHDELATLTDAAIAKATGEPL